MIDGRLLAIGTFALLLPVSIENPAALDSAGTDTGTGHETRVSVVGAFGNYALIDRGCNGAVLATHPHEFSEGAIEALHRLPSGVTFGVRGGFIRDRAEETVTDGSVFPSRDTTVTVNDDLTYYNSYVAYEGRSLGVGWGWIWSSGDFGSSGGRTVVPWSAHVRLGRIGGPYFRVGVMEGFPLYAGGGYADLGFGMHPNRVLDVYAGLNGGPYDGPGLVVKLDWRVRTHVAAIIRGRLGSSGGEPQSGIGLGLTYVSNPPVDPVRGAHHYKSGGIQSSWGLAPKRPPAVKDTTAKEP